MNNSKTSFILRNGTTKPFKTLDEQLDILIGRGLIVNDRAAAINILRRTNYYRFSAYSLSLRKNDQFNSGVSFDDIYELYKFDDEFRKVILEYSSYIEISYRSYIAYEHTKKYGPLGYMVSSNFDDTNYHKSFIEDLTDSIARADDLFVEHHKNDYNGVFPLWVAIECTTFGNLSKLYKNLLLADRKLIDTNYAGIGYKKLANWLNVCVHARNIAAHGGRFYNRRINKVKPSLNPAAKRVMEDNTSFAVIYVLYRLLPTVELQKSLIERLLALFAKYSFAKPNYLGFPENWDDILKVY